MGKVQQSGKIWVILPALIFMMTCGLVVYAATSLTTSSSFTSWRTNKMGNTLTATDWNVLMDKLEGLDGTVEGLNNTVEGLGGLDNIPAGAIMAFNLAECPCGWDDYDADGKFLMGGKTTNQTETGGAVDNHIHLRRQQLPKHSHTYIDTVFSEPEGIAGIKVGEDGIYDYLEVGYNDFGGIKVVGNWNEDDLYPYWYHPVFGFRKTTYSICDNTNPQVFLKRGEGAGGRGYNDGCNHASGYPEFVDITPAYVKVKYCKKSDSGSCNSSSSNSSTDLINIEVFPVANIRNSTQDVVRNFTLNVDGHTFTVNNHPINRGSQGSVVFNSKINQGFHRSIKIFANGHTCYLETGGRTGYISEAGWIGGESSHGNGYYWICS